MFNFDFYNPTHIVFGKDRLDELDALDQRMQRCSLLTAVDLLCAVALLIVL